MKKIISLFLVVVMIITLFACGKSSAPANETETSIIEQSIKETTISSVVDKSESVENYRNEFKVIDGKKFYFDINGKRKTEDFNLQGYHYEVGTDGEILNSLSLVDFNIQLNAELPEEDISQDNEDMQDGYYRHCDKNQKEKVDEAIDEFYKNYIDGIIKKDESDWKFKREMTIIEYFVDNMKYDHENYNANSIPDVDYGAYGALINKKAVCEGFANAFALLCEKCEIPVVFVHKPGVHAWNLVQLDDGEWYHVDSTWNLCRGSYTAYTNFNDEICTTISSHETWVPNNVNANGTKYSNEFVFDFVKDKFGIEDFDYKGLQQRADYVKEHTVIWQGISVFANNNYDTNSKFHYYLDDDTVLHITGEIPSEDHLIYGSNVVWEEEVHDKITKVVFESQVKNDDYISTFYNFKSLTEIVNFNLCDTSNAKNLSYMFCNCESLESIDLSHFNTESAENFYSMFDSCKSLKKLDLSSFNTKNVTNMSRMFALCENLEEINLSSFDVSNVEDFSLMFQSCKRLKHLSIEHFNPENGKKFDNMFVRCTMLDNIEECEKIMNRGDKEVASFTALNLENAKASSGKVWSKLICPKNIIKANKWAKAEASIKYYLNPEYSFEKGFPPLILSFNKKQEHIYDKVARLVGDTEDGEWQKVQSIKRTPNKYDQEERYLGVGIDAIYVQKEKKQVSNLNNEITGKKGEYKGESYDVKLTGFDGDKEVYTILMKDIKIDTSSDCDSIDVSNFEIVEDEYNAHDINLKYFLLWSGKANDEQTYIKNDSSNHSVVVHYSVEIDNKYKTIYNSFGREEENIIKIAAPDLKNNDVFEIDNGFQSTSSQKYTGKMLESWCSFTIHSGCIASVGIEKPLSVTKNGQMVNATYEFDNKPGIYNEKKYKFQILIKNGNEIAARVLFKDFWHD